MVAVVELEREVAGVVVDADMFFDRIGIEVLSGTPGEKAFEKSEGFLGVFEVAQWFGFEAEVKVLAGSFSEGCDGEGAGV